MLKNYRKFYNVSSQLKSTDIEELGTHAGNYCKEKYNLLKGESWPSWEQFEHDNFVTDDPELQEYYKWHLVTAPVLTFNIDDTIFDQQSFVSAVEELYAQLGFDDFNQDLVSNFWKRYIHLHQTDE